MLCELLWSYAATPGDLRPWPDDKPLNEEVRLHCCGHASYTEMEIFLQRYGLWSDCIAHYVTDVSSRCKGCRAHARPAQARNVPLTNLSRSLNEMVFVDHFYLDKMCLIHVMVAASLFSTASIVPERSVRSSILSFDSTWPSHIWSRGQINGDPTFNNYFFRLYNSSMDSTFRVVPPRRHQKHQLESNHSSLRSGYLRLKARSETQAHPNRRLPAHQAARIPNDLYGSEILSTPELSKG